MDALVKLINNDLEYEPFRATVIGAGGSAKSHMINTFVSIIRQYTQINQSIMVMAPLRVASYCIGGSTLHRSFNLPVESSQLAKLARCGRLYFGKPSCGPIVDNLGNIIIKEATGAVGRSLVGPLCQPAVSPNRCPCLHTHITSTASKFINANDNMQLCPKPT